MLLIASRQPQIIQGKKRVKEPWTGEKKDGQRRMSGGEGKNSRWMAGC